jgi:tRNA 2-thiocytidine biosynthesis protein TtcA
MTALLARLEADHPNLKSVMMAALANVSPSHLLDRELADVWQARPAGVRPATTAKPTRRHAAALPVIQGLGQRTFGEPAG